MFFFKTHFLLTNFLLFLFLFLLFWRTSNQSDTTLRKTKQQFNFLKLTVKDQFKRNRKHVLINSPAQIKLAEIEDDKDRSGKYAIVEISGRARWVEEGRYYDFYRIKQEENKKINLNRILFFSDEEGKISFGTPFLENIRVNATVIKHFRGRKIYRLKFKKKKHYRRLYGHRQEMSRVLINKIEVNKDMINIEGYGNSERKIERANKITINNIATDGKRKFSFFKDDPLFYVLNRIHSMVKPSLELKQLRRHFTEYLNLYCSLKFETFYKSKGNYKIEKMMKNVLKTKKLSTRPEVVEEVQKYEQEKKEKRLKKVDPLEDFDPVANEHVIGSNF